MTNHYYVGMDVHQRRTSLCLMDGEGTVVREWKIRTAPKGNRPKRVTSQQVALDYWVARGQTTLDQ